MSRGYWDFSGARPVFMSRDEAGQGRWFTDAHGQRHFIQSQTQGSLFGMPHETPKATPVPQAHPAEAALSKGAREALADIRQSPGQRTGMFDKTHLGELKAAGLVRFDSSTGVNKVHPHAPPDLPEGPPPQAQAASPPIANDAMSHEDAASHIADHLSGQGYRARPWVGGSATRVYVDDSKGRPMGHLTITPEGTVSGDSLNRQRGAVMSSLPDVKIKPRPTPAPGSYQQDTEPPDDPLDRMEWEHDRTKFRGGGDYG